MNEKGGVLGRRLELIVEDDQSKVATAVVIDKKLTTQNKVDATLGPYYAPIVDAVAAVSEKHQMPMVCPAGATTSTHKKGRRFIFMMFSPGEVSDMPPEVRSTMAAQTREVPNVVRVPLRSLSVPLARPGGPARSSSFGPVA